MVTAAFVIVVLSIVSHPHFITSYSVYSAVINCRRNVELINDSIEGTQLFSLFIPHEVECQFTIK